MVAVRFVCPCCARRYSGIVDPQCRVCHGLGLLAAQGEDPAAAARAVTMHLEPVWRDHEQFRRRRRAMQDAGLLVQVAGARGIGDMPWDPADRSVIGRRAGALLVELGLRSKPPARRKPEPRARLTKAEKAEAARLLEETPERRREQWRQKRRETRARERAAEVLAAQDPERFEQIVEGERVLMALDWD